MRKVLMAGLAALTFVGAALATAAPAQAQYYRYGWRDRDDVAIAGLLGLSAGAALGGPRYYGPPPPPPPRYYYYDPYYYGPPPPYGVCYGSTRVWDPYIGRYVYRRTSYPC